MLICLTKNKQHVSIVSVSMLACRWYNLAQSTAELKYTDEATPGILDSCLLTYDLHDLNMFVERE